MPDFIGQTWILATTDSAGIVDRVINYVMANQLLFIIIGAALIVFVAVIIILATQKSKKKKKQSVQQEMPEPGKVFVPVEQLGDEVEAEFLTLKDSIIESEGELGAKIVEKIRNRGPQALAEIVSAYDKCCPEVQQQLVQVVQEERLLERYAQRLNRPDYPQGILVDAWAHFPSQETLKEFVEMLASRDESIQLAGTRLLCAMREPKSLTLLTAALMWPEHFVPARVAEVFAAMGQHSARLLAYVLPKVDDKHKVRVLDTIAMAESAYPAENVSACLAHKDPAVRSSAALALGAGRMVEGVAPLMVSAVDKSWQVRAAVAKALGMIGDQRALSILEVLAQDTEGWVSAEAKKSLEMFAKA